MTFNTIPLPLPVDYNNRIYEFNPELVRHEVPGSVAVVEAPSKCLVPETNGSITTTVLATNLSRVFKRRKKPTLKLDKFMMSDNDMSFTDDHSTDSEMPFTDSELELLPDLADDTTPLSSPEVAVPTHRYELPLVISTTPKLFFDVPSVLHSGDAIGSQIIDKPSIFNPHKPNKVDIFSIPEIVHKIVSYASIRPETPVPVRRRPLNYNHALLIHGNRKLAEDAMELHAIPPHNPSATLHSCSLVNKLFNGVVNDILSKEFWFNDETSFFNYLHSSSPLIFKPNTFKLEKIFHLSSAHDRFNTILANYNWSSLTSVEVFLCPHYLPPVSIYTAKVTKIAICGSKVLDDTYVYEITKRCPNLQILDLRGCELVTDTGIYYAGKHCHQLESINLGRKNKGHLITDSSVSGLIKNNPNLNTVGLAGCHITDKTLWDLTSYCNYTIERLSFNNCPHISNQSIPLILHAKYLPQLNVLEIRFTNIDNLKPIIEFKRRQEFHGVPVLVELCEQLSLRMRQQEMELDKAISERIFEDIQLWANEDDGDLCYRELLRTHLAASAVVTAR